MREERSRNRYLLAAIGGVLIILGISVFFTGRLSHTIYGPLADYGEHKRLFGAILFAGGTASAWLSLRRA